ncbi:MAG: cell division protein [Prolixibacteraceae bacterium]|nr:MAG: cell division protein [Prolixibacteraceae bacterium]
MASKSKLTVAIDIGTSRMAAVAGAKNEAGKLEIIGFAKTQAKGVKRGIIFNIEDVADTVKELLTALELKINERIDEVYVAYAGQHMKTVHFQRVKLTSEDGIVSKADIDSLFEQAKNAEIEEGYKLVEIIPVSYVVDNERIEKPVGTTGRKVEANYKLLIIPNSYWVNLLKVFGKLDVKLEKVTLSTLAVAEAVITHEEKEMGVIVLDIGSGTTNLAIFHDYKLIHTAVIPFGGEVVTNDIREGCSILYKWAEQLKVQYGQALGDFADDQKVVTIPGNNGWEPKEISFKSLAFIIQARLEEIIDSVNFQIEKPGIAEQLGAGIVLTGGTSNLENIVSLVKFRTGLDVRKANLVLGLHEKHKELQNGEYFTALGLLNLVERKSAAIVPVNEKSAKVKKPKEPGKIKPWIDRVFQGVLDLVDDENEDVPLK